MVTRPACRSVEFAETFKDPSVVAAYRYRPAHPPGTFDLLRQLIVEADLVGPYALITAADSLSRFDLGVVIPRFAELLSENGVLAVVDRSTQVGLREDDIIPRYSLNRDYVRWDPVTALEDVAGSGCRIRRGHEGKDRRAGQRRVGKDGRGTVAGRGRGVGCLGAAGLSSPLSLEAPRHRCPADQRRPPHALIHTRRMAKTSIRQVVSGAPG